LQLDVRGRGQIAEAAQQTEARFGAIDVLVNNAGYGYRAAVEEASEQDIRDLFDTRGRSSCPNSKASPAFWLGWRTTTGCLL
jgi:NAD(P)-dependent dehydrogenase (short-subunit alcohol dehydrogenase family)